MAVPCSPAGYADQQSVDYLRKQPLGQVPIMEEEGRPPLFDTGAILLDVAS
jgi:glutathione S-transferase